MIIQRQCFLDYLRDVKKIHSVSECSSSEKYEEIHFLLLPKRLWDLLWPHKNEMSYLFCQSWGDYSREQLEKLMPDMTEWCALNLTAKDIFKMSRTILLSETRFSRY